ncbi:MAG: S-methyl-5-thioribose-1-phosphate isomerase [Pseudomonadota bacterium]|nr:S-methyl-5-thioribose-1-phosphate isomerase [Pseudomonadota bacterium]
MKRREDDTVRAVDWVDGHLRLLDQRRLPESVGYIDCYGLDETALAIADMVVRGAPAIGITAAYGIVLAARACFAGDPLQWKVRFLDELAVLGKARPTAVNLAWAIRRMSRFAETLEGSPEAALLAEATRIHEQDIEANYRMGDLGSGLIDGGAVLTHCNAGALATGGYGTALGVVRSAWKSGKITGVFADETRPWLQGSRLTAWELVQEGIPVTLLCEGASASLLRRGGVSWVVVGADRVAANGDVANKVGTYGLALHARRHGVGFMVVAPTSTVDMGSADGDAIPVEQRPEDEVLRFAGHRLAPEGTRAWNPVFDTTPADLVDALVTERGVILRPDTGNLARLMAA